MTSPKRAFKEAANVLQLSELNGHSVHVVDGWNPRSCALLAEGYEKVYKPAFKNPADRESLDKWIEILRRSKSHVKLVTVIVGKDLDTPHPIIKGVATAEYYPAQDVGQMAYVAISPDCRNEGLGRVMVDVRKAALLETAKTHGGHLRGIFLDCKDPEKVKAADDSIDPAVRIAIFQKWGARIMPIDFILPPLHAGDAPNDKVKLLAYPHPQTGAYPTPAAMRGFIEATYQTLAVYSKMPPSKNPDYQRMMAQISALGRRTPPKPSI